MHALNLLAAGWDPNALYLLAPGLISAHWHAARFQNAVQQAANNKYSSSVSVRRSIGRPAVLLELQACS